MPSFSSHYNCLTVVSNLSCMLFGFIFVLYIILPVCVLFSCTVFHTQSQYSLINNNKYILFKESAMNHESYSFENTTYCLTQLRLPVDFQEKQNNGN